MKNFINLLILTIFVLFINVAHSGTCTSISRTNNSANSVLTSTKYNLDNNTAYSAINAADGGCITSGTLEKDALNTTDFSVLQSAPKTGCGLYYHNASTVRVGPCRISIDNDYTKTTTGSTVAFGCSGCSGEVGTTSYYVYATTSSATSSLDLLISTTAPDVDGYSGTSRVLGRFFNQGNSDISTSDVVSYGLNEFEPQTVYLKDIKAPSSDGGTFTAGAWRTRTLNDVQGDASIVSLASNQFTLQAGVYDIDAEAIANSVNNHVAKLRNITDSTDQIIGKTAQAVQANSQANYSRIIGRIVITSAKVFEIQHQCDLTQATDGFGDGVGYSVPVTFTQVKITKRRSL